MHGGERERTGYKQGRRTTQRREPRLWDIPGKDKVLKTESYENFTKTEPFFVKFIFMTMKTEEMVILAQKVLEYNIYASYYIIQVYIHILVTYNVV